MAVRRWWVKESGGKLYLVSRAGLLSVYDPHAVFTGRSWDAQSASVLFATTPPRSILLLGLGGGTVARQCRYMFPAANITAVEADKDIITLARRAFGVRDLGVRVIWDRAEEFLVRTRQRFDVIIEDAWPMGPGQARIRSDDDAWETRLERRLTDRGVLAVNVHSRGHRSRSYFEVLRRLRTRFAVVREVGLPGRLTTVLAAASNMRSGLEARGALGQLPLDARDAMRKMSFRCVRT